jgi:cell wall-associated NlpC family hydrolase
MSERSLLVRYALSLLGTPYRWGGENPIGGFDCSGLVQEILRSVGMDPPGDQSAQALFEHFVKTSSRGDLAEGALAFYGSSITKINHVAFMIDSFRVIEAGGGGSKTLTKEDANLQNAFIRIRPVKHRADFLTTLMPTYLVK